MLLLTQLEAKLADFQTKLCPCKEKWSFVKNSNLETYLKTHCLGWSPDPQNKYTANFIVAVLLANFKNKGLLKRRGGRFLEISTDRFLRKVQGFNKKYIDVGCIRRIIVTRHFEVNEGFIYATFLCPSQNRDILYSILGLSKNIAEPVYIYDLCEV